MGETVKSPNSWDVPRSDDELKNFVAGRLALLSNVKL